VNIVNARFRATGRRKWLTTTVQSGYIATKSVIRQKKGGGGSGNHYSGTEDTEDESALEALQRLWHLLEEGGILGLLGSRTPRHIYFEEMTEKRLGHI